MNPVKVSFSTESPVDYTSSIDFNSFLKITPIRNKPDAPRIIPAILENPHIKFVSVLAHEVRNPLTNINLSVEMLKSALKEKELEVYIDIIARSSRRINDLVNELLKYQLADEVPAENDSIHTLLDEVLEMARDRIRLKDIVIIKEYDGEDCKAIFHRPRMKIAITNIIINAIDAMTPGRGELKIVTTSIEDKYVIQIEDNGCGMSDGNLKNIFKPFFTNKPDGLGLGLATTYDILRSNRVGVSVESQEGTGTRFVLVLEKRQGHNSFQN